jgi:transposase
VTEEIGEAMGRQSTYTPEFRRNAVEYVVSSGKTYAEVAASLGVNESTLAHWVRSARREEPSVGERRDDAAELRARVRELEMENEFLKKAAAFFAARQA